MASIKFLQNINLFGSQLQNAIIQPLGSAPTVYGNGQIYYDSGLHKLYLRANGAWVAIQSGTDSNTTYDLTVPAATTAIRLAGSDGTNDDVTLTGGTNVTITRTSATQITISATDSAAGTVTSVSGGTGITISGSASVTPTVNIDYAGTDNAILAATGATPVGGDTVWFSDATDNTIKKALIEDMPGFGKDGTVTSVATSPGTFIAVSGGTITTTGTITADLSASGTPSATKFLRGDNAWATPAGAYTDWKLKGDGGTAVDIGDGETVDFIGGTGLDAVAASASPNTLTLSLDLNELSTVTAVATDFVALVDVTDSSTKKALVSDITSLAPQGTVTSVGITETGNALTITNTPITGTGNINIAGAGSASQVILGNLTLATLPVDGVTSVGITPGTGLDVSNSPITSSGNIGVTLDLSELTTVTTIDPAADFLVGVDGTDNEKILYSNVHLDQWGKAEADVDFDTNKLLKVKTGTASGDGVNLGQVQALVAGVGVFQGGYNATTNSPAIAGASNVALTTGDFYVVTTDGTIAFNGSSVAVEVGDMIYANSTISASSNPAATAYAIVIQDQNIAGVGATDGATEKGVAGFSSASFAGTANGFITIKAGGISNAMLANTPNYIIGTDTDIDTSGVDVMDQINVTDGVITSMSKRTLPNATTGAVGVAETATQAEVNAGTSGDQLMVTPATLKAHIDADSFASDWPSSNASSEALTHSLSTLDVIVQIFEKSTGATVYADVVRNSTSQVTISTTSTITANTLRVLVQKIR
jgi:hypothetical protein